MNLEKWTLLLTLLVLTGVGLRCSDEKPEPVPASSTAAPSRKVPMHLTDANSGGNTDTDTDASDQGPFHVAVEGDRLYVFHQTSNPFLVHDAKYLHNLRTFDVSDPANPRETSNAFFEAGYAAAAVKDARLYLVTPDQRVDIFSEATRGEWHLDQQLHNLAACLPPLAKDGHIFIVGHDTPADCTETAQKLMVIERSGRTDGGKEQPNITSSLPVTAPQAAALAGNDLYICEGPHAVLIDVTDPLSPKRQDDTKAGQPPIICGVFSVSR